MTTKRRSKPPVPPDAEKQSAEKTPFASVSDAEMPEVEKLAYEGHPREIVHFILGLVERKKVREAIEHAAKLCSLGYMEANGALAECMEDEPEIWSIVETVSDEKWLERMISYAESSRPGNAGATFLVACHYEDRGNVVKMYEWFVKSANKGYEEAALCIAWHHLEGDQVPRDVLEAARWFMRSLEMPELDALESIDADAVPVNREIGWANWDLLGEMISRLPAVEDRVELVRIISKPFVRAAHGDEAEMPAGATLH